MRAIAAVLLAGALAVCAGSATAQPPTGGASIDPSPGAVSAGGDAPSPTGGVAVSGQPSPLTQVEAPRAPAPSPPQPPSGGAPVAPATPAQPPALAIVRVAGGVPTLIYLISSRQTITVTSRLTTAAPLIG